MPSSVADGEPYPNAAFLITVPTNEESNESRTGVPDGYLELLAPATLVQSDLDGVRILRER
jgi:hypothetical protein